MKIIQLNIWQGRLLKPVISFLQSENADIVCLQEVLSSKNEIHSYFEFMKSLEVIQSALPEHIHCFFTETFSFDFVDTRVRNGIVILSKSPLSHTNSVVTHDTPRHIADFSGDAPNIRVGQFAQMSIDGTPVWIVNHHGYREPDVMGSQITMRSTQILADACKKLTGPIIFCSDLNIVHESPAMRVFDDQFIDLSQTHNIESTLSPVHYVKSPTPCDHILVTPEVHVDSLSVSERVVSDHKALIMEFHL